MVPNVEPANGHSKPVKAMLEAKATIGAENRSSIRMTTHQAVKLKDLTYMVALELSDPVLSDIESDLIRARAQAIAGLVKSWDICCNRIRVQQGKPNAGSLRPEAKPKKVKHKPQSMLSDDLPADGTP